MLRLWKMSTAVLAVQIAVALVVYVMKGSISAAVLAATFVASIACVNSVNAARSGIWAAYAVLGFGMLELLSVTGSTFDAFLFIVASVGFAAFAAKMEHVYEGYKGSLLSLSVVTVPIIGPILGGTLLLYGRCRGTSAT